MEVIENKRQNNLDVLKRLSNLEKVIYGSEKEDKE